MTLLPYEDLFDATEAFDEAPTTMPLNVCPFCGEDFACGSCIDDPASNSWLVARTNQHREDRL